jgi:hypothetical protein
VLGCIPFHSAPKKQSGGELSLERCASPAHWKRQRWSSTWSLCEALDAPAITPTEQATKNMSTP